MKSLISTYQNIAEQNIFAAAKRLNELSLNELSQLCFDIRMAILAATSANGGHVSSNLGVVELSVALWQVFDPYKDRLFWDVSHQVYAHKLLSGRSLRFLRTFGNTSGYLEPAESAADAFCAGHSSTSISLAVGAAKAFALRKTPAFALAIIGDGAMGSGLAYEALNELGSAKLPAIVVLNDNKMSISAPIGALSRFLSQSIASPAYQSFRKGVLKALEHLPTSARFAAKRIEDSLKLASPIGMFFEELGLNYIGPIDGHDISACVRALNLAKSLGAPVLVHVITQKGRGYASAQNDATGAWHGVGAFEIAPDFLEQAAKRYAQSTPKSPPPSLQNPLQNRDSANANSRDFAVSLQNRSAAKSTPKSVAKSAAKSATAAFSAALSQIMAQDERVCAITAAMPSGTGLDSILAAYPSRCWDVGIAEAHACTQAAALAKASLRPVVAVYSTFAQRAIDSIIHDIALNCAPVTLALDRAGVVGQDGKTHQGVFDLALLRCIPNFSLFAPVGERSMAAILRRCIDLDAPAALRYARGQFALAAEFDLAQTEPYFIRERGSSVLALGWGEGVASALAVGDAHGFDVANLVCAKPILGWFLERLRRYEIVLVYSHTMLAGGLGELLAAQNVRTKSFEFSDEFITHGHTDDVLRHLGKDDASLIAAAAKWAR